MVNVKVTEYLHLKDLPARKVTYEFGQNVQLIHKLGQNGAIVTQIGIVVYQLYHFGWG